MMASASIPAIFPPVVIGDDAYVDGGIREQIPIEVAVLLGGTEVYAIFADTRDVEPDPAMKHGNLLSIAARSLMGLAINELTYSDAFHAGGWGPGVEMKVIQPRVDVHGSFTIYPALVRNRMAYGYICAADVIQPAQGNEARCEAIADEIAVLRYGAARLEAWLEGRRVPPTLISLSRPSGEVRNKVRQGIFRLKLRVHSLATERAQLGGTMPPENGSWTDSKRWWQGWERHPLLQLDQAPQNGEVCAISSSLDHLHVFVVTSTQRVMEASWNPESGEGWEGWFQVAGVDASLATSQPGSPIHAASRHDGSIDLMIAGTQGEVRTAQWDRQFQVDDGWTGWHDWSQVGGGQTAQRGAVTATSRRPEFLDIFTVGTDGHVWTNAIDTARQWGNWRRIDPLQVPYGAPIHAVSRKLDDLDIFATDSGGNIQWSHWDPSLSGWTAWSIIRGGRANAVGAVTAVSRRADFIDLFVVGADGGIYTAALDPANGWQGWWRIGTITAPFGSTVTGVSRASDQLDVFVTDGQQRIQWSHWDPTLTGWTEWMQIQNGRAWAGNRIAATSRAPGLIDVFVVGLDGRVWSAGFNPSTGWAGWWRLHADLKPDPLDSAVVEGGLF
jgi:hypothetical protein